MLFPQFSSPIPDNLSITDLTLPDGSLGSLPLKIGASNRGLFSGGTNEVTIVAGGVEISRITDTTFEVDYPLLISLGSASTPSFRFNNEQSGLYQSNTGELAISLSGSSKYIFSGSKLSFQNQLKSGGSAPTVVAGAAAGSSPTVTLVSGATDTCGQISVISGSSGATTGVMATVTFNSTWSANPKVILTPANSNASQLNFYQGTISTTQFTLDTQNTLANSTTYLFNYIVIQ